MSRPALRVATFAIASLLPAVYSMGAVTLTFSDKDSTPTTTGVAAGGSFTTDVFINASATSDKISGLDYRLQISAAGSGYFKILSRTTNSAILTPEVSDSSTTFPLTLGPTSGSPDLGADRNGQADLSGINTFDTAAYTIQAAANTPKGTYTLSFVATPPTYSGAGPSYPTLQYSSIGTFSITVPEPATATAAAMLGVACLLRRRTIR